MFRTVRGRLAATLAAVAAASVAVTALVSIGLVSRFAREDALRLLRRDAAVLARESRALGPADRESLRIARRLIRAGGGHVAQITPRGEVLTEDPVATAVADALNLAGAGPTSRREGTVAAAGRTYAYVFVPAQRPRAPGGVVIARPASLGRDLLGPVVVRVALAGAAAVLVALGVSVLLARRLSSRVRRLSQATGAIAAGDLSQRVDTEGADEIAELGTRFNAMAASLAEARRREHEFLASVSHELRTPITAIRGYAEALADGTAQTEPERERALAVIDAESDRLERLVQDVIDLARLGAHEFGLEIARVDLARTLREAADAHASTAADAGVTLSTAIEPSLPCETDPARVRQIVSNLVENALRVTPSGGTVRITGAVHDGGGVAIEVADTGPGIAPADLAHVFERSYLWRAYRGERPVGNGLGLAIVRELATALGARVDVASEPGAGSRFRLRLPAQAPSRT